MHDDNHRRSPARRRSHYRQNHGLRDVQRGCSKPRRTPSKSNRPAQPPGNKADRSRLQRTWKSGHNHYQRDTSKAGNTLFSQRRHSGLRTEQCGADEDEKNNCRENKGSSDAASFIVTRHCERGTAMAWVHRREQNTYRPQKHTCCGDVRHIPVPPFFIVRFFRSLPQGK